MEWPSQSPDLNIIEPLWKELNRPLDSKRATNTTQKFAQLEEEWKKIPQSTIDALINSLPRHCQTIIDAKDFAKILESYNVNYKFIAHFQSIYTCYNVIKVYS